MRLTRRRRRLVYGVMFLLIWLGFMLLAWNRYELTWQSRGASVVVTGPPAVTTTPGDIRSEWGALRYLTIIRREVDFRGRPMTATSTVDWQWRPTRLMITVVVSALVPYMCIAGWRRTVRRGRLIGRCDECGYDLTGATQSRCPECGAVMAVATR